MHRLLFLVGERSRDEINPIGAPRDWPRCQQRLFRLRSLRPPPQTAKPPLVGPVAQTSRVRIPLHVLADREKMMVILDGERLESALIQMAVSGGVIMSMMALGVREAQPLAESPHFSVDLRADHPMPVIRQETIRKKVDLRAFQRLGHHPLKGLEVLRLVKDRFAPIASVEHVINALRLVGPWWAPQPIVPQSRTG